MKVSAVLCDPGEAQALTERLGLLSEVRVSSLCPRVIALLENHRDCARDLGTHGLGLMYGRPENDPQRVSMREMERILGCLIVALGGES